MKITFIHNTDKIIQPHIGLTYIMASLKQKGFNADLLDIRFKPMALYHIEKYLKNHKPDIVGLSSLFTDYKYHIKIARFIKQKFPYVHIIMGGHQPTLLPNEILKHACIDSVCIGEGEEALVNFFSNFKKPTEGIWYKENGKIIKSPLRPFIEDLDSLPFPDWQIWDNYRKYFPIPKTLLLVPARGCLFTCNYCGYTAVKKNLQGNYYRERSPSNIVAEIIFNLSGNNHIEFLFFESENFNMYTPIYFDELRFLWKKEKLHKKLRWGCRIWAGSIQEDWVKMAKEMECVFMSTSIETGNEEVRYSYNKPIKNKSFIKTFELLHKYDIKSSLGVMVGTPLETVANIKESLKFAESLNPTRIGYWKYLPLPKTEMAEKYKQKKVSPYLDFYILLLKNIFQIRSWFFTIKKGVSESGVKFLITYFVNCTKSKSFLPLIRVFHCFELNKEKD